MSSDATIYARFLNTLSTLQEHERQHLLRIESVETLRELWALAMSRRMSDVAGSIEVAANAQGDH